MGTATKQQNRVPVLRFPDFKDDWQQKPLSVVAKIQRGRFSPRPRNDPRFYNGKTPFVQTGDVVNSGGYIEHYTQTLNDEGVKVSKIFPKGSILITIAANIGYTGILSKDMACPDSLIGIIPNADTSNEFLNHFLTTQREYMDRVASVGAQKNINIDFLNPFPVSWTVLPEQQKIADFLGSVNSWLDNLRQQKTALETYKRGMMQKLFTQQVRFKDDNSNGFPDWQEKKLSDVSIKSNTGVAAGSLDGNDGEYAVYGASGLYKHVDFYQEKDPYITIIKDGSGVGRTAIYPGKSSVIGTLNVLKATEGNDLYFVYLLLTRLNLIKYVIGGAIPHIYYKDYKREKVMVPSLPEQQKIADFLTALDETIKAKVEEITRVEKWKKGLMQKMFV